MEGNNDSPTLAEASSDWTGTYTWRVENWTRLTEKAIFSPDFEIDGYTWRLLVLPRGHRSQRAPVYIIVVLHFKESSFTPPQMCPKAKFQLMTVKVNAPEESLKQEATHTFTNQARAWGFTQFLSIQEAQNPQNGFLVDDALTFSVSIRIEKDDDLYRMSRKETGFVGLKNQGATGYLNALMQCLFHIKCFRRAVYQMPTLESDVRKESVPLALQTLFHKLQYQNSSVNTKDLTMSFGWGRFDFYRPRDIQEMPALLWKKLEEKMKGTSLERCIPELFKGQYSVYIECLHVDHTEIWAQPYMEIELDVFGCKDVYDSLEKLCGVEILEGANRYKSEEHGLVDAKRYALFDSFPTVFQFNVKRCYYNPANNAFLKMNSHYEFYDELDLDYDECVLLSKNADTTVENKYRLHSVVVHRSGPDGGHYFAFIRRNKKWYEFDNEVVKAVSAEEAINEQFGDQHGTAGASFSNKFERTNKSAAIMLIYVRKSEWNTVMCDAGKQYLPKQVRERFENEQKEKEKRHKEKDEAHLYMNVQLATEFHFAEQLGKSYYFGLADFDNVKNYRIYKKTSFEDFKGMVSKDFGIREHLQRFWRWEQHLNSTMRISEPLIEKKHGLKTVLDLRHFRDESSAPNQEKTALMTIKLFLESLEQAFVTRDTRRPIQRNELLIFLKCYDPELSRLSYLGHVFVDKTSQFRVIFEKAKKMAGLGPEEEVIGVKEVEHSPSVICLDLEPQSTPEEAQLLQGDSIIIQKLVNIDGFAFPFVREFLESIQSAQKDESNSV